MTDGIDDDAAARLDIAALIGSDVDGLLDVPEKPKKVTSTDRLERAFLEIVEFRRSHDRLPSSTTREIAERKLGARLDGILADPAKVEALTPLDEFGLLTGPEAPSSMDDLLAGDDFDLLADDSGLLDVSDLPQRRRPESPDSVATRVKAADFEQFARLFTAMHAELAAGKTALAPFAGAQTIEAGKFFVLGGVMAFVAEVGESTLHGKGTHQKLKQRLRVIFENGTESSMYRQSLSIRMYEADGQAVVPTVVEVGDVESGHVYVLRSLSDDPAIASIPDLYKIGFSTTSVEKRIAHAEKQPTYLMAPVEVVADYRTNHFKTSALENLLHRVFAEVRLDISQTGPDGRSYNPSEWFVVPLPIINQVIMMIIGGDIVHYTYDPSVRRLVEHDVDEDL